VFSGGSKFMFIENFGFKTPSFLLPSLKKEYEWLAEAPSQVLQQAALNLSSAFLNFFEGQAKYPNFKKKQNRQSIRFPQGCKLKDDILKLPKIGDIHCKVSRRPEGTLKSVTVVANPSGEYFASCLYDDDKDLPPKSSEGKAIGIDVGLIPFFKKYVILGKGIVCVVKRQ
jgi:putative transposase